VCLQRCLLPGSWQALQEQLLSALHVLEQPLCCCTPTFQHVLHLLLLCCPVEQDE
jgi:hypothetical protein